nr:Gag protein [Tanacetum cinerariifolium]
MAEENPFTISVDAFGDRPDRFDPKEPPVDPNISNPTLENHTRDHTLENASENTSGDPVMQCVSDSGGQPEEAIQQTPRDATLAARIRDYNMSDRFKVPTNLKTYDGTSDPDDHLTIFMGTMDVHKLPEPPWCRFFHINLCRAARFWYDNLPSGTHLESRNRFSLFSLLALMKLCACVNKSSMDSVGRAIRSLKSLLGRNPLINAHVIIPSERSFMCRVSFPNLLR